MKESLDVENGKGRDDRGRIVDPSIPWCTGKSPGRCGWGSVTEKRGRGMKCLFE